MPFSNHAIENDIVFPIGQRIGAAELSVEIGFVLFNRPILTADGIEEPVHLFRIAVFHRDAPMFAKGQGKVHVHATGGVNVDGDGQDLGPPPPTAAEEIAQRRFHTGDCLPIPVHPQNQITEIGLIHSDPDMGYRGRTVDVH